MGLLPDKKDTDAARTLSAAGRGHLGPANALVALHFSRGPGRGEDGFVPRQAPFEQFQPVPQGKVNAMPPVHLQVKFAMPTVADQPRFLGRQRAGTLDGEAVNAALAETDLMTIRHRVKFEGNHFSRGPLVYGQWQKTSESWVWECPVIFSVHDFIEATADPLFPIPYD